MAAAVVLLVLALASCHAGGVVAQANYAAAIAARQAAAARVAAVQAQRQQALQQAQQAASLASAPEVATSEAPVAPTYGTTAVPPAATKYFNRNLVGFITASYYGGQTDGGSCGYGKAAASPFGIYTASASTILYGRGHSCGACYVMTCVGSPRCLPKSTPQLTISNECAGGDASSMSLCGGYRKSFSMAPTVWNTIAVNPALGFVPITAKRVPCMREGGVQFKVLVGNPYFFQVLIQNVAGSGDLVQVWAMLTTAAYRSPWTPLQRSYGSVWALNGNFLAGVTYHFRLTTGTYRETITIPNAIPAFYAVGQVYSSRINFKMAAPRTIIRPGKVVNTKPVVTGFAKAQPSTTTVP